MFEKYSFAVTVPCFGSEIRSVLRRRCFSFYISLLPLKCSQDTRILHTARQILDWRGTTVDRDSVSSAVTSISFNAFKSPDASALLLCLLTWYSRLCFVFNWVAWSLGNRVLLCLIKRIPYFAASWSRVSTSDLAVYWWRSWAQSEMLLTGLVWFLALCVFWTCTQGAFKKPFLGYAVIIKFSIIFCNTDMSSWQLAVIVNRDGFLPFCCSGLHKY